MARIGTRRALLYRPPVAANWWEVAGQTCVAAYQPKGAASLAASYVNLANPGTYDATAPVAAPSFDTATGWTFNGSTQYLATGVTPGSSNYTVLVRYSGTSITGDRYVFGAYNGAGKKFGLVSNFLTGAKVQYENGGSLATGTALVTGSGVLGFAGNVAYRDGAPETGTITAGTLPGPFHVGARNRIDATTVDAFENVTIQAMVVYSTTLTALQIAALTAAMNAL